MKRKIAVLLALIMVCSLAACGRGGEDQQLEGRGSGSEIAMIIDGETMDTDPFHQGIWSGIKSYGQANEVPYQYYPTAEKSEEVFSETIQKAIEAGAKVVVVAGENFQDAVFSLQNTYLDVSFILVDGSQSEGDEELVMNDNVAGIVFAEEEAGYMAGYAAVQEGYRKLGFMGGTEQAAVVRFGYGFVQGADAAAEELKLSDVEIKYHYADGFDPSDKIQQLAQSWYDGGVDTIFACCGAGGNSVMAAAEPLHKSVIGVDVDQSQLSNTVVISATKNLSGAVEQMLTDYYNGEFPGGQIIKFGAKEDGVGLSMESSRLKNFTAAQYEGLLQRFLGQDQALAQGGTAQSPDTGRPEILTEEVAIVNDLPTRAVSVSLVE